MTYEIEKNIPVPEKEGPKYPFKQMEVGDSFFVECQGFDAYRKIANAANSFQRRCDMPIKFTVRMLTEGVRVWRIA